MGLAGTRQVRPASRAGRRHLALVSKSVPRDRPAADARRESWHAINAESSRKALRAPATGARAVSPRSERQADAVAFLVERDVVHQVANDEQPAPVLALEVVGMRRIGKAAGIEAEAVVVHENADEVAPQLYLDAHDAIGIFPRPIPNRVPERFGEGGAEIEADATGRQGTGRKVTGDQFDGIADHPEIARDLELHRLGGHIQS